MKPVRTTLRLAAYRFDHPSDCTRKAIVKHLRQRYPSVRSGRFALNPYHIWFICE